MAVGQGVNGKVSKVVNSDSDIGGETPGRDTHDRVNGGGWASPASDVSLFGSDSTGTQFPGYYINRANGISLNGGTWTNTGGSTALAVVRPPIM